MLGKEVAKYENEIELYKKSKTLLIYNNINSITKQDKADYNKKKIEQN